MPRRRVVVNTLCDGVCRTTDCAASTSTATRCCTVPCSSVSQLMTHCVVIITRGRLPGGHSAFSCIDDVPTGSQHGSVALGCMQLHCRAAGRKRLVVTCTAAWPSCSCIALSLRTLGLVDKPSATYDFLPPSYRMRPVPQFRPVATIGRTSVHVPVVSSATITPKEHNGEATACKNKAVPTHKRSS